MFYWQSDLKMLTALNVKEKITFTEIRYPSKVLLWSIALQYLIIIFSVVYKAPANQKVM